MLDKSISQANEEYCKKAQYNSSAASFHDDVAASISDLESDNKILDSELKAIKEKLEVVAGDTREQFKSLDKSLLEIREMARDAKHISIGVDGKNGLRGAIQTLSDNVGNITSEISVIKHSTHSYEETRGFLGRLVIACMSTVLIQIGAAMWFISSHSAKQEAIRSDLNRVISYIDKVHEKVQFANK
jgi:hypothetical protein